MGAIVYFQGFKMYQYITYEEVHVRKKVGVRTSDSIDFGPKTVVFDKVREKRTPREERWVGKAMPNGRT